MHLAIDALQLRHDHRGVGRYVRRLLTEMPRHREALRYTLGVARSADVEPVRAQLAALPGVLDRSRVMPIAEWRTLHCDVAWYPWNYVRHRPLTGAIVPTIHDLAPMLQLDGRWWKVLKRHRARRQYRHALAVADLVMTGATAARDEIVARLGADPRGIHVVPHAADGFRPQAESSVSPLTSQQRGASADALLASLQVSGPFLLAVGSQEARKNLRVLFDATARLHAEGRALPLVLCGSNSSGVVGVGATPPSWLRWAGFVSDEALRELYARCTALVFPSRYEGFGLPVLEALTAGGVVVCSDASTLPEVGGDAALYFSPDDAAGLAQQVRRLLEEPELRGELLRRGALQAARFSWAQSARDTLAVFDAAIVRHG